LGEIVFCLCAPRLVLDGFESGEEQTDQDRNNCDYDQQLDESERAVGSGRGTHGANASRNLPSVHVKCLETFKGKELNDFLLYRGERSETSLTIGSPRTSARK